MATPSEPKKPDARPYEMRISRNTVDKLGVKLYDQASAVVAELVANSYDADAEEVTVRLPLGTQLAARQPDGKLDEHGYSIEVEDNGHGMTPSEAIDFFLRVGRDRRRDPQRGSVSQGKKRPVMGRKGIGKLAPFGICRTIEVISSGGSKMPEGYITAHFVMCFDDIVKETDEPVSFMPGKQDRTYSPKTGTKILLRDFSNKRVPATKIFHRQLARRFVFATTDFAIFIEDTRDPANNPRKKVDPFEIPLMDGTKVDVSNYPVSTDTGQQFKVTGWLGLAKEAYKDEEMAGVRVYARNKIVATTRDFEQPAGFTGEFTTRSYLVGEVHAEWLDFDEGEDLVRTDRQGILWDSELGNALRKWGGERIREIGAASRKPRRERVRKMFVEKADFENKAKARFSDSSIVRAAVSLAEQVGGFAAEDELEDSQYVEDLSDVLLAVAPHKALIEAFQEFSKSATGKAPSMNKLADLFGKTRLAELASYVQIASERVRIIGELEKIIQSTGSKEEDLQRIITEGPWLVHPTWSVITINQRLKTFKTMFEQFWKKRTGTTVTLAITYTTKRPDFVLVSADRMLHIVEIKAAGHVFTDADFDRMYNYVEAFEAFFEANITLMDEFNGWQIDLVADDVDIKGKKEARLFKELVGKGQVVRITWVDFLNRAKVAHEQFLDARDRAVTAATP
ncbi:ATP-binding protein [Corallococcus terminator]